MTLNAEALGSLNANIAGLWDGYFANLPPKADDPSADSIRARDAAMDQIRAQFAAVTGHDDADGNRVVDDAEEDAVLTSALDTVDFDRGAPADGEAALFDGWPEQTPFRVQYRVGRYLEGRLATLLADWNAV